MKKILYLVIITVLMLFLCSCSNETVDITYDTTISSAEITAETTTDESMIESTTEQSTTTEQNDTSIKNHTETNSSNRKKTTLNTSKTTAVQNTISYCSDSDSHGITCGEMGKWFNSRKELETYYSSVVEGWNNKLNNNEITWKEYVKSCPQGYKSWSCSYCGKWTGNFKYDERKWCTEGGNNHWLYNYEIGWYSSYYDAEKAAEEYLKGHSEVGGYLIAQCDCGLYTATFYQK